MLCPTCGMLFAALTGDECEGMLLSNHLSCCDKCTTEQMWSVKTVDRRITRLSPHEHNTHGCELDWCC